MRPTLVGSLIAATLATAACHARKPVTLDQLNGTRPAKVWVTRGDQSVVVVDGPQAFGDRLVGFVDGKYREMPAADVKQLIMQSRAPVRTAALVVAGTLGIATLAYVLTSSGSASNPCDLATSECVPN